MSRIASLTLMVMAVALFGLAGCGGGASTPEAVMKETVNQMNEMASAMDSAKKASDAKPRIEAAATKLAELKTKYQGMKVSAEQEKELKTKLEPEMKAALSKFMAASIKLGTADPDGMKSLEESLKKVGP